MSLFNIFCLHLHFIFIHFFFVNLNQNNHTYIFFGILKRKIKKDRRQCVLFSVVLEIKI